MIEQKKFLAALKQIASEKNLEEEVLFEIVKSAFAAAYKKDFKNKDLEVKVELDFNSPDLAKIYVLKEVVEDGELFDDVFEIEETLAKKEDPDVEVGDELYVNSTPEGYGRIAAQSAKQVILQKIQEAGRTVIYEKFKNRESQIVMGTVNRVEGFHVFIDVEKTVVLLPEKYRIKNEKYFPGKRLWLYIENVALSSRGPQIVLSRTHKNLVQKVMEVEIPEVASGEVDVVSVARDPGFRSKVAVVSDDENLDPVGACIGPKGIRVKPVMEELAGERIDIIKWSDDPLVLLESALQPAKISKMIIVNSSDVRNPKTNKLVKKRVAVFVTEEDRAMAIGKKGQNIRLASDLTGYEIDMYDIGEYDAFMEKFKNIEEDSDL